MLENLLTEIQVFLATTPPDIIGAYALIVIAPFPIFGVLIWGFSQVWLDRKQGQYASKLQWDLLAINVPQDSIQTPKGMENFFNNLAGSKSAITWKEKWMWGKFQAYFSFEIISMGGNIQFYIRTIKKYRDLVEAAFYAQYPEAQITVVDDYVDSVPNQYPDEDYDMWGSELVLGSDEYLPIKTWEKFEHVGEKDLRFKDPILPILEMLGKMQPGETYWLQFLIMGPDSQDKWRKKGEDFIKKVYGIEDKKKKSVFQETIGWLPAQIINEATGAAYGAEEEAKSDDFRMFKITPQEKDQIDMVNKKISNLGWYSKIRFVYTAKKELFRKGTIAAMTKGMFNQFTYLGSNKLGLHDASTPKDDYFYMEWQMPAKQTRLTKRYQRRSFTAGSTPYILTSEELATLFHFPPADARTPVLTALGARRAEAPGELSFAAPDMPTLMNMERTESDTVVPGLPTSKPEDSENTVSFSVPRPAAPTGPVTPPADETIWTKPAPLASEATSSPVQEEYMPKAGMPAPLPPGLDLSDQPVSDGTTPEDLPI